MWGRGEPGQPDDARLGQRPARELQGHAIRSEVSDGESLLRKVEMGLLDAALVYQPTYGRACRWSS
jgi:hypothetical protein